MMSKSRSNEQTINQMIDHMYIQLNISRQQEVQWVFFFMSNERSNDQSHKCSFEDVSAELIMLKWKKKLDCYFDFEDDYLASSIILTLKCFFHGDKFFVFYYLIILSMTIEHYFDCHFVCFRYEVFLTYSRYDW